jgi:hypothetical protein
MDEPMKGFKTFGIKTRKQYKIYDSGNEMTIRDVGEG